MADVDIETFRLRDGQDVDAFLAVDARVQEWHYRHRPGLIRRTVARDDDGGFLVVTLASAPWTVSAVTDTTEPDAWRAAIDETTYERRRYRTLA